MSMSKILICIFSLVLLIHSNLFSQQVTKLGSWSNVESFAISQKEDYLVIAIKYGPLGKLFEIRKKNDNWSSPEPILTINNYKGGGADIGGPFLSYDGNRLYYHANFADSKGGYDIYYSEKEKEGWSKPIHMNGPFNTSANQLYPSIDPGQSRFIYAETYDEDYDFKKSKDSPPCEQIMGSYIKADNTWEKPDLLHQVINAGCQYSPVIAPDGKTIYFSSYGEDQKKDGYQLKYTKEFIREFWVLPLTISVDEELEGNKLNPRVVGNRLYFINDLEKRKESTKEIYYIDISKDCQQIKTIEKSGEIISQKNEHPLDADITVFDPTTLNVIGRYKNAEYSGDFNLYFPVNDNYIITIRKPGYSFASYDVDLRKNSAVPIPDEVELFDSIDLRLNIYDEQIYCPIQGEVTAKMLSTNKIIQGKKIEDGIYTFKLALGSNYAINASADGYNANSFLFKLEGDIVFSLFDRNLPLEPLKSELKIRTMDAESGEPISANVQIKNKDNEEPLISIEENTFSADGSVITHLRNRDKYEINITKEGYFFHSQIVDLMNGTVSFDTLNMVQNLPDETYLLTVAMDSLREEKAITLNNINFENNSFALSSSSFEELDRLITLLKDNPTIKIEVSAHTDNVGSSYYNKILSDKRAQSVVNYLVENQIPLQRMESKGYGFSKPLVPNSSDKNRAINRRVEFKVIKNE